MMELLHSKKLSRGDQGSSTQKYVDVDEIKDGVVILKDGSLRSILLVSSVNFDLKSNEEKETIIHQYQSFLNSLDFPVQIVITSRKLNITPYLEMIQALERRQTNELLRLQTSEYRRFISRLIEVSNIMTKNFYLVVPFSPIESESTGAVSKLSFLFGKKETVVRKRELFETYKSQLWQRVDYVSSGIVTTGVSAVPLNTEEIIELLYNSYNPSVFTSSLIKDIDKIELKV